MHSPPASTDALLLRLAAAASPTSVFRGAALLALLSTFAFYGLLTTKTRPRTVKQKAWIVTFLSASLTTAGSVPFLIHFLSTEGGLTLHPPSVLPAPPAMLLLAHAMCGAFQGFLVADLLIGYVAYPSEVSLLTGWVHHIIYALLLPAIATQGWAHVFALCLSMEAPTAALAAAHLWPRLRNDTLHAVVFFVFRIALHLRVLYLAAADERVRGEVFGGSWAPAVLFAMAFALHAWWFFCSITGIMRRAKAAAQTKGATVAVKATPAPVRPSLMSRRRSSLSEYLVVKSRSARKHAKKRHALLLAVPAAYTLAKLAGRYAPMWPTFDAL